MNFGSCANTGCFGSQSCFNIASFSKPFFDPTLIMEKAIMKALARPALKVAQSLGFLIMLLSFCQFDSHLPWLSIRPGLGEK